MAAQEQQHQPSSSSAAGATHNVVGVHYRVGKKIGEGSFGIIYEGNVHTLGTCARTDDWYIAFRNESAQQSAGGHQV
jgi:hypothetical protein